MSGSTLASRVLGRQLQKFRERAGLSQNVMARAAETSPQTYGRLEDGVKHNVPSMMINALCDRLRVSDSERRFLLSLGEEVRHVHKFGGKWWRADIDEISSEFDHYMCLHDSARRLTTWSLNLVPGLLQTAGYRREIAWAENPLWTPEQVDHCLSLMTRRQERLTDSSFEVEAILSEMILRQMIGSTSVMADQLLHLVELGDRPNVTIRVAPFGVANAIGPVAGSFVWMDFSQLPSTKLQEPPAVYVEEYVGRLYLERREEIAPYRDALTRIRRIALNTDETRNLILAIAREYSE
ncbi:helix-turn-helix domain-containing protein [Nocardia sp. NPDC051570]|uniref:helix-turn-helix domain-containing protein n=1 Tax=Nocardia sp. NPDC051570 TaxID=3364324 RepID=UPI003794A0E4